MVTGWFSEALEYGVSSLRVLDGKGQRVDEGNTRFDPSDSTKMSITLRDDLGPGFYLVTWETLSRIDGHFRFGSFQFTVLNPDGSEPGDSRPPAGDTASIDDEAARAFVKMAGLAASVILVGGLAFVTLVVWPAYRELSSELAIRARDVAGSHLTRLAVPSVMILVLVGISELLLQARQIGGIEQINSVLDTSWGQRWLQQQSILVTLVGDVSFYAWLRQREPFWSSLTVWLALLAGLAYLFLVSIVSHAAAVLEGSFWAVAFDYIHLLTAAIWIGSLIQLGLLLARSRPQLPEDIRPLFLAISVQRFSLLAAIALIALLATGAFNALIQVSRPEGMITTAYGRLLTSKLALLLPLLAVTAFNAVILRPRFTRATLAMGKAEWLRDLLARLVALEAALALAVLSIVAALVQQTPARIDSEASAVSIANTSVVVAGGDAFAYPLAVGNWGTLVALGLIVGALLAWIWASQWPGRIPRAISRIAYTAATGLSVSGIAMILAYNIMPSEAAPSTSGVPDFTPAVTLRLRAGIDEFVSLEIAPFQLGENIFRVTVLDGNGRPFQVDNLVMRFSKIEHEGILSHVQGAFSSEKSSYVANYALAEIGWWAIDVVVAGVRSTSFYIRLDDPSQVPLKFAPPDYQSDPVAGALFREALEDYDGLLSVKWEEQLTSGLNEPIRTGSWVVTNGEAEAPDKVHFITLSPGLTRHELYRMGNTACSKIRFLDESRTPRGSNESWQCRTEVGEDAFDLEFMEPSNAFRLGRREVLDGEMTQVLLFYNPSQPAWYAWWIGEETGYLRRQLMIAPGHFMLTRYFDHNLPVGIQFPSELSQILNSGP